MKEKKQTEIATNTSSGAEKVETVVEKTTTKRKTPTEKTKKERAAAEDRVKAAQAKQKRKAERLARIEMRKAEERAELERLEAKRKARAEKRREQAEKRREERAHTKAERKRKSREGGRKESNGGWIAAVVSLGAVTLALATTVTIGAIDMKRTKDGVAAGYKSTTYELMGIMENIDSDLDRVRLSASTAQQERILTDILVQARLAELDLEKLPVQMEKDRNITIFINRVGAISQRMLSKLRNGEQLSKEDETLLGQLYTINRSMRSELGDAIERMSDKDISDYIKDGKGMLADVMDRLEKITLTETGKMLPNKKMEGAGTQRTPKDEENQGGMSTTKAEELCASYFEGYRIQNYRCTGETVGRGYRAYNLQGYDDKGTMLFAEIDQESGKLLRFDYYEECKENTLDIQNAQTVAEAFLYKLGYEGMEATRVRENGTDVDFTFSYTADGVVCYTDSVRVKVCRARGVVTGLNAVGYNGHCKDKPLPKEKISESEARSKLHDGLTVQTAKRCLVATERGERLAYEFLCSYEDESYFVYIDAINGAEISIVNLKKIG